MANVVRFYRGLKASYNATTHADGIYFATDVGQILMNGVEYGGDSDKKVANVELNTQANGIVITYTDTTSTTLLFGKASTVVDGLMSKEDKAKLDSIQTAVSGGITSLTSPDETITITGTGTSRGLVINTAKLVSTTSSIQVGDDGKLDMFWIEVE